MSLCVGVTTATPPNAAHVTNLITRHRTMLKQRGVAYGDAPRSSDGSTPLEGVVGEHSTQVINWAMTQRRLDVKSAPWHGNNPPSLV